MNEVARARVLKDFSRANHLDEKAIPRNVKNVISHAALPFRLFVECLQAPEIANSSNPVDGLIFSMALRIYNSMSGSLVLLSCGNFQQAEIMSRTVMESSISLLYISKSESNARMVGYFKQYLGQEKEQNRKWAKELTHVLPEIKEDHEKRILEKNEYIEALEEFTQEFSRSIGENYSESRSFPNFIDVCSSLGRALEYRTVYAAMCSQAHHDAEDVLNDLLANSVEDDGGYYEKVKKERDNFSIFLILHGVRYFLECLSEISSKYRMQSAFSHAQESRTALESVQKVVAANGFTENSLKGWRAGEI